MKSFRVALKAARRSTSMTEALKLLKDAYGDRTPYSFAKIFNGD